MVRTWCERSASDISKATFLLILVAAILLATVTEIVVSQYDPHTGEILEMRGVHVIAVMIFGLLLAIVYLILRPADKKAATGALPEKSDADFWKPLGRVEADSDLYLLRQVRSMGLLEYRIRNKDGTEVWQGECRLDREGVLSIGGCSGAGGQVFELVRAKSGEGFLLSDSQAELGVLKVTGKGLSFTEPDGHPAYAAVMEEENEDGLDVVINWILTLDTGRPLARNKEASYFLFNKEAKGALGKYFWALNNLDLTADLDGDFDRKVAVAFAVFIDTTRWLAGRKSRPDWKNLWGQADILRVSQPSDVIVLLILLVIIVFFSVNKLIDRLF
ncbi:MAG: hypothetical protein P4N41_20740 [Negativicutes bacterium]|nr:hypothetical protein [Negativicutes bacterium]